MDELTKIANELEQVSVSNCFTTSPENSANFLNKSLHDFKILHTNIRSLNRNFDNLVVFLHRLAYKPDVIILTECWLSKCHFVPPLEGYNCHASNFLTQNDGVVVYVKDTYSPIIELPTLSDANCLLLKFSDNLALVAVYRSPACRDLSRFFCSLDGLLGTLVQFKSAAIIGDLNINIAPDCSDPNSDEYLNITASHAMLSAYTLPTRLSSCLDHVIIRCQSISTTLVLDSLITDHSPVILFCNMDIKAKFRPRCNNPKIDVPGVVESISNADFSCILDCSDPNVAAESFVSIVSSAIKSNSRTPVTSSKRRIIKPWITPGLLRCIRHRDNLYRKFKKHPGNETYKLVFCRYRNYCNNLLKKIKTEYERGEFYKARNNPKATWAVIKQLANLNHNRTTSSDLLKLCDNPSQSVDKVNDYFANVGRLLASKIPRPRPLDRSTSSKLDATFSSSLNSPIHSMALYKTDGSELDNIIVSLKDKSAVGIDDIPTSVIKATRFITIPVLVHIFNLCLTLGVFPDIFKTAIVHPIYKTGSRDSVTNYRPISVLTILSKILEKLINIRLTKFLSKCEILASNQFGFQSGKATEDAVLELTDTLIKNLENKSKTLAIFLDLSKAFDTVSVPLLLSKLEDVGIRGVALDIFKSYLTGRGQHIKIENHLSSKKCLNFGVPQGSVLGPSLFLIYVNELCRLSLPNCKIVTYADDTALIIHGRNWNETAMNAERALSTVMKWLSTNLLTLNVNKTKFITFSINKSGQPLTPIALRAHSCFNQTSHPLCDCPKLESTQTIKYLGVIVDCHLKWHQQINSIVGRLRKLLYVFKKLRTAADFNTLISIYFALAQSVLGYCITAWGGAYKTAMLRIERAQRAVLKVLAKKPIRYPTTSLYSLCQVLTVRQLFIFKATIRKHSNLYYEPDKCKNIRRSDRVCSVEPHRSDLARHHFPYLSSKLYNKINKILNIYPNTINDCKKKLDSWLKSLTYDSTESLLGV